MNLKEQLGKRIQDIRKSKNIKQEELAELIGIETISMSKIETGKSYPTSENLTKIARILKVDPYELFIFKNSRKPEDIKQDIINLLQKNNYTRKQLIEIFYIIKS